VKSWTPPPSGGRATGFSRLGGRKNNAYR